MALWNILDPVSLERGDPGMAAGATSSGSKERGEYMPIG